MLSSSRGDFNKLSDWVKLETAKGIIPAGLALLALYLRAPIPMLLVAVLFAGAVAWGGFVAINAYAMAFRMNRRLESYMKAVGVDTSLPSILGDKELWRKSAGGMTMREFIKARRTIPARC